MKYKNVSSSVKTFYGVTFEPGATKDVGNHIISNKWMIVAEDASTEAQKTEQQKPSSVPKTNDQKKEEPKQEPEAPKSESDKKDDSAKKNDNAKSKDQKS